MSERGEIVQVNRKGTARRNREKSTRYWQRLKRNYKMSYAFDDVTSKEFPWHAVRKALEQELTYPRDVGMYEEVDEREDIAQYQVTPVDTKWVDTDRACEEEPMQIRSRIVARESKSDDRPDLYARAPPLEALKSIISIAANHKEPFSIMNIDVSHAYFHAKVQTHVLVRLPVEDRLGADAGKMVC